jgi:hypothetical protein
MIHVRLRDVVLWLTRLAMPDGHVQSTGDSLVPSLVASPQ